MFAYHFGGLLQLRFLEGASLGFNFKPFYHWPTFLLVVNSRLKVMPLKLATCLFHLSLCPCKFPLDLGDGLISSLHPL
jgi:hypothetical protein